MVTPYVVGVDFGTLSGRAVVVRASDGAELGSAVHEYAHGVIERTLPASGERLPPQWALQDPEDYLDVLRTAVPAAVQAAGVDPSSVVGIATDFTASTPLPVLSDGTPLCRVPGLETRAHAYVKLWKHHAAQAQADRINAVAAERNEAWLPRYGGKISSEWEFAKALQILDEDPELYARMDRWVESRRLDRLAAVRRRDAQRVQRRLQGDPPGRPLPEPRVPGGARRGLRRFRRGQARRTGARSSAPAPAASPRRPRRGPACPRGSRSPSATSTRT